jgi:hypothetical protein
VLVGVTPVVPEVGSLPDQAPSAMQVAALVELQVSVVLWPCTIVVGLAAIDMVGAAGLTVTDAD